VPAVSTGGAVAIAPAGCWTAATAGPLVCAPTQQPKTGACRPWPKAVYAEKMRVDVWWKDEVNAAALFDAGRGPIEVYFRAEIKDFCEDGRAARFEIHPCVRCSRRSYSFLACKVIQITFPDDSGHSPTFRNFVGQLRRLASSGGDSERRADRRLLRHRAADCGYGLAGCTWIPPSSHARRQAGCGLFSGSGWGWTSQV